VKEQESDFRNHSMDFFKKKRDSLKSGAGSSKKNLAEQPNLEILPDIKKSFIQKAF